MPRIRKFWQKKSFKRTRYDYRIKARQRKKKTKFDKLVLTHSRLEYMISECLIQQSKGRIDDYTCIENIRKLMQDNEFWHIIER